MLHLWTSRLGGRFDTEAAHFLAGSGACILLLAEFMRWACAFLMLTASACLLLGACGERGRSAPASSTSSDGQTPIGDSSSRGAYERLYDTSTVETIRGQVTRVEQVASEHGRSRGVHVIVKLEGGDTMSVHLGPAHFIENQELSLASGDLIEVTGSRVSFDGAPALIARRIVKENKEFVLRDESGFPRWSAARRAGAGPITAGQDAAMSDEPTERKSGMSILNNIEIQALLDALDDEYKAWATYDQVIDDFGPERPFSHIREAEARHIDALRVLLARYGIAMPENTWPGRVPRYASTREACKGGIEAEVENAALYDRLMQSTTRQDILAVFDNLQRASQERHLPAFRRCATQGAGLGARR